MSDSILMRLDLVEKKLSVMQQEVSEVLGEMQTVIGSIAQAGAQSSRVLGERLSKYEESLADLYSRILALKNGTQNADIDTTPPTREAGGREL